MLYLSFNYITIIGVYLFKVYSIIIKIFWILPDNWRANIQSGLTHKSGVKTGRVAQLTNSPQNAIDVLQAEWPNQQCAHIALPHCAMRSRAEWRKQQIHVPKVLNIRSLSSYYLIIRSKIFRSNICMIGARISTSMNQRKSRNAI